MQTDVTMFSQYVYTLLVWIIQRAIQTIPDLPYADTFLMFIPNQVETVIQ